MIESAPQSGIQTARSQGPNPMETLSPQGITRLLADWQAGVTLFAASVNTALALYGFRVSLGGRSLFRGGLLED